MSWLGDVIVVCVDGCAETPLSGTRLKVKRISVVMADQRINFRIAIQFYDISAGY
jgi:hypothetical protein